MANRSSRIESELLEESVSDDVKDFCLSGLIYKEGKILCWFYNWAQGLLDVLQTFVEFVAVQSSPNEHCCLPVQALLMQYVIFFFYRK